MDLKRILRTGLLLFMPLLACGGQEADPERQEGDAGASLFRMHCTLCHGDDGRLGLSGAKDLTASALSREEMIAVVRNGRGAMMGYGRVLSEEEIGLVVDHVRSLEKVE